MELVLVKLIISVFIIKEVSIICVLHVLCSMFTLSVPPVTPTVEIIPTISVINEERQVSVNISVDVSGVHYTKSVLFSLSPHAQTILCRLEPV